MTSLADALRRRIARDGPITVAEFMAAALTDPAHGYYMRGDPFGAGGDFVTAPEISQMFGELIGLWCAERWRAMAAPDPVQWVELGPGRGTLMADMLRAAAGARDLVGRAAVSLVEISPALRAAQKRTLGDPEKTGGGAETARRARWLDDFGDVAAGPLLLVANEFFDALPVRQFVATDGGWRERLVAVDADGKGNDGGFRFALADAAPEAGALPDDPPAARPGTVIEVRPGADALAAAIGRRLARDGGWALIVDYGHDRTAAGDTLQAVAGHQYADPLQRPGERDLTAHVDFGRLTSAAAGAGARTWGPVDQGAFLTALGIGARADALAAARPERAGDIRAAEARLTASSAMGRLYRVLALAGSDGPPPPGFG